LPHPPITKTGKETLGVVIMGTATATKRSENFEAQLDTAEQKAAASLLKSAFGVTDQQLNDLINSDYPGKTMEQIHKNVVDKLASSGVSNEDAKRTANQFVRGLHGGDPRCAVDLKLALSSVPDSVYQGAGTSKQSLSLSNAEKNSVEESNSRTQWYYETVAVAPETASNRQEILRTEKIQKDVDKYIDSLYRRSIDKGYEDFKKAYQALEGKANATEGEILKSFAADQAVKLFDQLDTEGRVPGFSKLSKEEKVRIITEELSQRLDHHRHAKLRRELNKPMSKDLADVISGALNNALAVRDETKTIKIEQLNSYAASTVSGILTNLPTHIKDSEKVVASLVAAHPIINETAAAEKATDDALTAKNLAQTALDNKKISPEYTEKTKQLEDARANRKLAIETINTELTKFFASDLGKVLPPEYRDRIKTIMEEAASGSAKEDEITIPSLPKEFFNASTLTREEQSKRINADKAITELLSSNGVVGKELEKAIKAGDVANLSFAARNEMIKPLQEALNNASTAFNAANEAELTLKNSADYQKAIEDIHAQLGAAGVRLGVDKNGKIVVGSTGYTLSPELQAEAAKTRLALIQYLDAGTGKDIFLPELEQAIKERRPIDYQKLEQEMKDAKIPQGSPRGKANRDAANMLMLVVSNQIEQSYAEFDAERNAGNVKDGQDVKNDGNYSQGRDYGAGVWQATREMMMTGTIGDDKRSLNRESYNTAHGTNLSQRAVSSVYGTIDEGRTVGLNNLDIGSPEGQNQYMKELSGWSLLSSRQVALANGKVDSLIVEGTADPRVLGRSRTFAQDLGNTFNSRNALIGLGVSVLFRVATSGNRVTAGGNSGGGSGSGGTGGGGTGSN
jgi:hypothetical protein